MSRSLGPAEAANLIRPVFEKDRMAHMDPKEVHGIKFVEEVCDYLGADKGPATILHVRNLLREADIALPVGQEYPRYVKRGWDGAMVIANDEEHARQIENEEAPKAPENPPSAYLLPSDKNALSDISDNVPKVLNRESVLKHDDGRTPSDISNQVPKIDRSYDPNRVDPDKTDLAASQGMPDPLTGRREEVVEIDPNRINDDVIKHDPQDDINMSEDNKSVHDNKMKVDVDPFKDNGEHTIVRPEDLSAANPDDPKDLRSPVPDAADKATKPPKNQRPK